MTANWREHAPKSGEGNNDPALWNKRLTKLKSVRDISKEVNKKLGNNK
jgi:hypothetical protein